MSKKIISAIIAIVVIVVIILLVSNKPDSIQPLTNETDSTNTEIPEATTTPLQQNVASSTMSTRIPMGTYTLAQVVAHSTSTDCWTTIKREVYDLTAWIKQHPGGSEAILSICGKDGTVAFTGQHAQQSGPASALATFKIGTLIK